MDAPGPGGADFAGGREAVPSSLGGPLPSPFTGGVGVFAVAPLVPATSVGVAARRYLEARRRPVSPNRSDRRAELTLA